MKTAVAWSEDSERKNKSSHFKRGSSREALLISSHLSHDYITRVNACFPATSTACLSHASMYKHASNIHNTVCSYKTSTHITRTKAKWNCYYLFHYLCTSRPSTTLSKALKEPKDGKCCCWLKCCQKHSTSLLLKMVNQSINTRQIAKTKKLMWMINTHFLRYNETKKDVNFVNS